MEKYWHGNMQFTFWHIIVFESERSNDLTHDKDEGREHAKGLAHRSVQVMHLIEGLIANLAIKFVHHFLEMSKNKGTSLWSDIFKRKRENFELKC